jgi:ATP diphosphatase
MTAIEQLLEIMATLRDPKNGCPWDKKQTFSSLVSHTIEEAHEVVDAIDQNNMPSLQEELGDLLFQVIFYCQIAQEKGEFDFQAVVSQLNEKLIRRHPHVFDAKNHSNTDDEQTHLAQWEAQKAQERAVKDVDKSVLADIPLSFPALMRADKIQKRCAQVGFDWPTLGPVVEKIHEELDEVMFEVTQMVQDPTLVEEEMGDLLFATVNLSRHIGVKPERALMLANQKFERRFREVEIRTIAKQVDGQLCNLDELELAWVEVKKEEKNKINN